MRIILAVLVAALAVNAQYRQGLAEREQKQLFSSSGLVFPNARSQSNSRPRIQKEQLVAQQSARDELSERQLNDSPVVRSTSSPSASRTVNRPVARPQPAAQEKEDASYEEDDVSPPVARPQKRQQQEAPTQRKVPNYPQEYLKRPQGSNQEDPRKRPQPVPEYEDEEEEEEEEEVKPDKLQLLLQKTKFSCVEKKDGYYADDSLNCEVFHYCQDKVKHSWLCPEGASFHQVHLICMPAADDNICQKSAKFHFVNDYLYKTVDDSKDGTIYADRYYPEGYEHGVPYDLDKVEAPNKQTYRPFQEPPANYNRKPSREPVKENYREPPTRDVARPPQYAPIRPYYDSDRQGSENRPQFQKQEGRQAAKQPEQTYDEEVDEEEEGDYA